MKNANDLATISLLNDFFWSTYSSGIAFGNANSGSNQFYWPNVNGANYLNKAQAYSIFDSGTSSIYLPDAYFKSVLREIYKRVGESDYSLVNGVVNTFCYRNFPTLYFMFDGNWLAVDQEDYVVDISRAQDESQCVLLLQPTDSPIMIFGGPIFRGNYVVHDSAASTIGFVPHTGSSKEAPRKGSAPSNKLGSSTSSSDSGSSSNNNSN
jgi:hypothetical protein